MNEVSSDKHGISRNVLKIIAIVTITIGHFFLYTFSTTRCFGVGKPWVGFMMMVCFIGPPIFMFFISEGFIHTSSRKRYGTRLLIFALITQIAFSITTTGGWGFSFKTFFFNWNVFFALFLGFIDLCIIESRQKPAVKVIGILATLLLSYFTNTECSTNCFTALSELRLSVSSITERTEKRVRSFSISSMYSIRCTLS